MISCTHRIIATSELFLDEKLFLNEKIIVCLDLDDGAWINNQDNNTSGHFGRLWIAVKTRNIKAGLLFIYKIQQRVWWLANCGENKWILNIYEFFKIWVKSIFSGLVDFICCSFASIASICLVLKGFDNKLSQINASSSSSIMLSWKNGINHSKKLLNWTCEIDPIFTWLIVPIQQKCLNPFNFSPDAASYLCLYCSPKTNDSPEFRRRGIIEVKHSALQCHWCLECWFALFSMFSIVS